LRKRRALPRRLAFLLVTTTTLAFTAYPATAEDYPARPVKIVVPFGAGGPTDVYARAIAEELRKSLHQSFVMENRPGAGTTIGTEMVAKAAPDGYTLLMVSGTQTVNETLFVRKQYQLMRDLMPVAPLIVVVPGSVTEIVFVGGSVVYDVGFPSHGSCASTIGGLLSTPFDTFRR